jgi:hypothetical protein
MSNWMAKLTLAVALAMATPALAWDGHRGGGGNWAGPFIGGAIAGGILGGAYAPGYVAPAPYGPMPYQPYYHWICDPYGRCNWVWQ